MNETLEIIQSEFAQASFETFEMVLISMIAAAILGTILGLVLHLASNPIFYKNRVVNGITGTIINVIRSLPFIILIIVLQPLARLVVGTSIGPNAAIVPLSFAVFAFFARQVQVVLAELDGGVIEAAQASGATFWDIVGVYLSEGLPDLIRVTTVTLISLVGETAMAGAVGAGGIGNVAIAYGFNRYNHDVTILATIIIILIIFAIQFLGDFLTKKLSHK